MKTIILCGGTGTRMKEETEFKPKPLVLVGGKPILWHIMKIYAHYGYNDFILALGYKGDMIKEYFLHERTLINDFSLNTNTGELTFHNNNCDDFNITFVDTGLESLTGERVRRVEEYVGDDDFMVTYGDGVADININALLDFHNSQNVLGTITGVHPSTRFGFLDVDESTQKLRSFFQHKVTDTEDNHSKEYINGGFMVFKREVMNMIEPDSMIENIFPKLADMKEMSVYKHTGKWKCMDTYKEVEDMNKLWDNEPFWKIWN